MHCVLIHYEFTMISLIILSSFIEVAIHHELAEFTSINEWQILVQFTPEAASVSVRCRTSRWPSRTKQSPDASRSNLSEGEWVKSIMDII